LEDAISSVVEFIQESDLTDIRLVGHSYAGMVISGVADRLEKRPRRLVYISAFVPLKGQSLNDMVTPDYAAAFAAIAEANNGAILLPFEIWWENFINDADVALARSTYDRLNPQPYRTFTDKISLQRPLSELSIGKSYINCQQDIALPHSYPWHPRLSERLGLFRLGLPRNLRPVMPDATSHNLGWAGLQAFRHRKMNSAPNEVHWPPLSQYLDERPVSRWCQRLPATSWMPAAPSTAPDALRPS
jgi:pimeloyl-ACP methyl ester carboxylesterase